jgi:L-seryl-tRNA(Ser) seleniumtransferase
LYDYEQAINSRTGAVLICHTSNYEIKGFTQRPALSDIIALAHKNNIPVLFDLGSGSLLETAQFGSDSEPEVSRMVQLGFDLISFSGDKLLGGPQAGLIVGKRQWVEKCKKNHLLRALRLDKFMIKLLQTVLTSYLYQTEGAERLDAIQALTMPAEVLLRRSEKFLEQFPAHIRQQMRVQKTKGKIGSGAYPLLELPSYAIQIIPSAIKVQQLAKQLRLAEVPIITYLADEALWIDLRAVSPAEEEVIFKTLQTILS